MTKVLDCDLEVSEFKPHLSYYVHFWTNTLGNRSEPPYSLSYGLDGITAVFLLQWLFWHWIAHKGRYAIKQRN